MRLKQSLVAVLSMVTLMTVIGCSSKKAEERPAGGQEGERLFKAYCEQCHRLPSPNMHTADEWLKTMEKMDRYIRDKQKKAPEPGERALILGYLQSQARK